MMGSGSELYLDKFYPEKDLKKVLTNGKRCDILDKLYRAADKRKRVHRSLKIKQYCKE